MAWSPARRGELELAATWMIDRGWKRKLAKKGEYEQSLFEHSLGELDVISRLAPILAAPEHLNLSDLDIEVLKVAALAHDAGKETNEWQAYLMKRSPQHTSHIDIALTKALAPEICSALGYDDLTEDSVKVIENCINTHHPSQAGLIAGILQGSGRWTLLARLIRAVDHLCSAAGLFEAISAFEWDILGEHFTASHHLAAILGVSTTLLHKAAEDEFAAAGWIPLLCFSAGTLYVCDGARQVATPPSWKIESRLCDQIGSALASRDLAQLMVGSPTANILPKPELFDYKKNREYLEVAAHRINRNRFIKKKLADRKKVVSSYLGYRNEPFTQLSDEVIEQQSLRIDAAQPEMMVFKFFKAMMSTELVGEAGVAKARDLYEAVFGTGAWAELVSTSTLMPAKDMASTVDRFWNLAGSRFGVQQARVDEVPDVQRTELLIDTLSGISAEVYAAINRPAPLQTLASEMAAAFMRDLIHPSAPRDIRQVAEHELNAFAGSKTYAGSENRKAVYLCPLCSSPFDSTGGEYASADFIDKPQSHTNRATAHGNFNRIVVCNACRYERVLLQVLVGRRPEEILVLLPPRTVSRGAGGWLVDRVRAWIQTAQLAMTTSTERGISLGFTDAIAARLGVSGLTSLTPEELVRLTTYRVSEDTQKRRMRELAKRLEAEYEDELSLANASWGSEYQSWQDAARAVVDEEVLDPGAMSIRAEIFHLHPTFQMQGETPNLIYVPLQYKIAANQDESEANRALRELYVMLLIGVASGLSVAQVEPGESWAWTGGEGVARVPPVPAVRALVGSEWVSLADAPRWIRVIGAAARLARISGFSDRSDILRVLLEDPPERLLVRIEQKGESVGSVGIEQLELIAILKEARRCGDR